MTAATPQFRTLDSDAIRAVMELHRRYLAGRSGGRRAILAHVDLSNRQLDGIDLREADLSGARLNDASLYGANLAGAVLFAADLRDTDLRQANLSRADLRGVCLRGGKSVV